MPFVLFNAVQFTGTARLFESRAAHKHILIRHRAGRVTVTLVLHICAESEVVLPIGTHSKFAHFSQGSGIHVELTATDHENLGGVAQLHALEVVGQHLSVAGLVPADVAVSALVGNLLLHHLLVLLR